jgi:hypothetical protein
VIAISFLSDVQAVNNFGDTREGGVAGPLGGVIVLLLLIATVLLIRNMNARLRRLPKTFPPNPREGGAVSDDATPDSADGQARTAERREDGE